MGADLEQLLAPANLMPVGPLEKRSRRLVPFRSFLISNEEPLRKIAASTK
jgi:hypothetical protein